MMKIFAALTAAVLVVWGFPVSAGGADTSNYCAVVDTAAGAHPQVATGYWYTDESGRRYCREIQDSASYVCMANGQLPTESKTITREVDVWQLELVTYTFFYVTMRPRPGGGSFADDAQWHAQFEPELYRLYQPDAPSVPTLSEIQMERPGWTFVRSEITAHAHTGNFVTTEEEVEIEATIDDFHNRNGNCQPSEAGLAQVEYDPLPAPQRPAPVVVETLVTDDCVGCGDGVTHTTDADGNIATHSNGDDAADARFVHGCMSSGATMTGPGTCVSGWESSVPEPTVLTCSFTWHDGTETHTETYQSIEPCP